MVHVRDRHERAVVDTSVVPPRIAFPARYNAAVDLLDHHLEAGRGARPALIDSQGKHTYADYFDRVLRAASLLRQLGVRQEERVLLCMHDGLELAALFWGAMRIGAVPVPLNTLLTADDYTYIVADSRARVLVASFDLLARFTGALGASDVAVVLSAGGGYGGYATVEGLPDGAVPDALPGRTTPDDVALWLYTSGSTGRPKAAMHLHRDLVYTAVHYAKEVLDLNADDVVFSAAKMYMPAATPSRRSGCSLSIPRTSDST